MSAGLTEKEIPVRMPQTRTPRVRRESLLRSKCQTRSTSLHCWLRPLLSLQGLAFVVQVC
jgi:hypothetical protein